MRRVSFKVFDCASGTWLGMTGWFHCWSLTLGENAHGSVSSAIGICEAVDGKCYEVLPSEIRFQEQPNYPL
jgi:hypothetical protein